MPWMIGAIQKYAGPKTERIVQETVLLLHLPHTVNVSTSIIFHNLLLNLKHLCMVILLSLYSLWYWTEHCKLSHWIKSCNCHRIRLSGVYKAYWNELKIILYPFKSLFFWMKGFLNASVITYVANQLDSLLKYNLFGLGWSCRNWKEL